MVNNFYNSKYIIVLGTTFSGSTAVYDYLNGRGDLYDPLKSKEYLLPILPNGLMTLEAISDKAYDPATTEYALTQFKSIAFKLINYWGTASNDKSLNNKLPFYKQEIEKFINEISVADFPMRLLWRDELMQTTFERLLRKIKNRLGLKEKISKTRLIVSKTDLIVAAQKMHDRMFMPNAGGRPILLDQCGSGWNPIESTKYFSNCKVVLITRDPRDQFVEIKHYKNGGSVEGFVDWYKEMQEKLEVINNSKILLIRFEDFVRKNEKFVKLICNHLSLPANKSTSYNSEYSKKNIGKFKQFITQKELQIIENQLGKYILE